MVRVGSVTEVTQKVAHPSTVLHAKQSNSSTDHGSGKRRASGIRCVHLAKPQRFHKRATHGSLPLQYVAQIRALDAVPSGKSADTSFLLDCCFEQQDNVLVI
jgi:hypothetical protein